VPFWSRRSASTGGSGYARFGAIYTPLSGRRGKNGGFAQRIFNVAPWPTGHVAGSAAHALLRHAGLITGWVSSRPRLAELRGDGEPLPALAPGWSPLLAWWVRRSTRRTPCAHPASLAA
jgi:hypothetical protein